MPETTSTRATRPPSSEGEAPPTDAPPAAVGRTERVLLRGGTPAVLVELAAGDADELLDLHRRLGERDTYLRFATLHPTGLERYVRRTLAAGSGDHTLGARVRGRLVGAVQLLPCGPGRAEVAVVVDAAARHDGVATALLERLAVIAGRLGIDRFVADVLADNGPMLRVLTDLGMPVERSREGTATRIEVALHPGQRYLDAAEQRYRTAAAASLRPVLRPRSVAVVGAGRREASVGRSVLRSLRVGGFLGPVHAVNPAAGGSGGVELEGVPCLPDIGSVPGPVDLAVVCVPAAQVCDVVGACGSAGVGGVLVLSGGLAGVPGSRERLRELGDRHGMRLVGPNSLGLAVHGPMGALVASFAGRVPPAGDLGLVAQSGGIAIAALSSWQRLGLGMSAGVAIGDAYDVGMRDVLAWFDEDAGTDLVVLYAESEPDLRSLVRTAAHLARRVPVLSVASGTSGAGARAAASHTARAATPAVVRGAAALAAGIQTAPDLTSLAAAVGLLRGQPLPRPGTVALLTNAGGVGVLLADACTSAGLGIDPLPPDLRRRLADVLPPLAATGNPVDTGAAVTAEAFGAALAVLRAHPAVAAVITATLPTGVGDPGPGVLAGAAAAGGAPVVDVRVGRATALERLDLPGGGFVISVADAPVAAHALAAAVARRDWLARPTGVPEAPGGVDVRAARAVVAGLLARAPGGDWLLPDEAAALCAAAGLPMAVTWWARSPAEAAAAAARAGGPVAVKGVVRGVVHKADAGLLRLPVADPAEVSAVVEAWAAQAGDDWRGAIVQPVVAPADELLVGGVRDPSAGAVVALGPGGRAADALGHRVHRLAPLSTADADDVLTGTGLFAPPHGAALDRAGVAGCLRRIGWLVDVLPELAEVEINPLRVDAAGCLALDVRGRVVPPAG
ncbi:GNAT family N-acetyltransferase [Trujillonella endophytica]|uniref:Acyl-CoA synthetase (NDP forming) n=1 Tax=Trujillonella endophytica TaxID=673521 RepID=A0A1H8SZB8_9ACTN|nr:GNAT family N-acetyltransferase [Trujillella endophytica]SEO84120.1 Acyl-CoA synthetase (NDP forming) [Trujillella endophytica]